jgi:hypothetical protein
MYANNVLLLLLLPLIAAVVIMVVVITLSGKRPPKTLPFTSSLHVNAYKVYSTYPVVITS